MACKKISTIEFSLKTKQAELDKTSIFRAKKYSALQEEIEALKKQLESLESIKETAALPFDKKYSNTKAISERSKPLEPDNKKILDIALELITIEEEINKNM